MSTPTNPSENVSRRNFGNLANPGSPLKMSSIFEESFLGERQLLLVCKREGATLRCPIENRVVSHTENVTREFENRVVRCIASNLSYGIVTDQGKR
jgi:hypothetical protein